MDAAKPPPEATSPGPYARLGVKYALLGLYGLASSIVGVVTLREVSGEMWELSWPVLVTVTAFGAFVGMNRSKITGKYGWEIVMTLLLIALLITYSILILLRTLTDGEVTRLPVALLPVVISVTPFARVLDIVRHKR